MNQNTILMYIQSKYSSKQMFAEKRVEVQKISALLTQYNQMINKLSIDEFKLLYEYRIFLEELRLKEMEQRLHQSNFNVDESFDDFPDYTPVDFVASDNFIGSKQGYVFKNDYKGLGYYLDKRRK